MVVNIVLPAVLCPSILVNLYTSRWKKKHRTGSGWGIERRSQLSQSLASASSQSGVAHTSHELEGLSDIASELIGVRVLEFRHSSGSKRLVCR